jgi:hypothetical protein
LFGFEDPLSFYLSRESPEKTLVTDLFKLNFLIVEDVTTLD